MTQILPFPMTPIQMQKYGLYLGLISWTMSSVMIYVISMDISIEELSLQFSTTGILLQSHTNCVSSLYCHFPIYKAF